MGYIMSEEETMATPPVPPLVEPWSDRPFSFYPPILNIEHNEWRLRKETWSEMQVVNSKTGLEVWVPRRYLGEVSCIDKPVMIVGLTKELEYKAGTVWPHARRVVSMPGAFETQSRHGETTAEAPSPPTGARLQSGPESRVSHLIAGALVLSIVVCILVVAISQRSVSYHGIEQLALNLAADDDYYSIVRKVGAPSEDRWREGTGELQYRLLGYRGKPYSLILMGTDRQNAHYIGAMDKDWKPIDFVQLAKGGSTLSMLRRLPRF